MRFDASHIRIEDFGGHPDVNNGKPWADELVFGIVEFDSWDDAVDEITGVNGEHDMGGRFDYGKTNMRVERGGKIILINVDTKERRIIECGC